jgi:hypothetical protein
MTTHRRRTDRSCDQSQMTSVEPTGCRDDMSVAFMTRRLAPDAHRQSLAPASQANADEPVPVVAGRGDWTPAGGRARQKPTSTGPEPEPTIFARYRFLDALRVGPGGPRRAGLEPLPGTGPAGAPRGTWVGPDARGSARSRRADPPVQARACFQRSRQPPWTTGPPELASQSGPATQRGPHAGHTRATRGPCWRPRAARSTRPGGVQAVDQQGHGRA